MCFLFVCKQDFECSRLLIPLLRLTPNTIYICLHCPNGDGGREKTVLKLW